MAFDKKTYEMVLGSVALKPNQSVALETAHPDVVGSVYNSLTGKGPAAISKMRQFLKSKGFAKIVSDKSGWETASK